MIPFHIKFNGNNIYFPHNLFKILILLQLVNFRFAIDLSLDFLHCSNMYKL